MRQKTTRRDSSPWSSLLFAGKEAIGYASRRKLRLASRRQGRRLCAIPFFSCKRKGEGNPFFFQPGERARDREREGKCEGKLKREGRKNPFLARAKEEGFLSLFLSYSRSLSLCESDTNFPATECLCTSESVGPSLKLSARLPPP